MAPQNNENTVFLSDQEGERIQNTVKDRLNKCSEVVGQPRESREAKDAISQATGASLMADMGGAPDPDMTSSKGGGSTIPALAVGQPYPPCTVSLQNLQPMALTDLRLDTHHRGHRLTVRRASPVVTLTARSWTMVQDEAGETERVEMCLHKTRYGEEILESSKVFVIKDPYFTLTDQGEPTIRIDHPSDLIVCEGEIVDDNLSNAGLVKPSVADATAGEKIAKKRKDEGNAALQKQELSEALAKYTEGLEVAKLEVVLKANPDLSRDISRNRAYVNLLLGRLDEVKTDAKASITGREDDRSKSLDGKANFRAACAAYNLGKYEEAKTFFKEQERLTPGDKDAKAYLRKIEARLREQETGAYDWKKIRAATSKSRPNVDVANFVKHTKVKDSTGRGRGLFATRDIPTGEIVICEKAFCTAWSHGSDAMTAMTYDNRDDRIRASAVGLMKSTVQKALNNPSQIEALMELYGDYSGDGKNVFSTEDGPVVDVFRVHDIVSRNAFSPGNQFGEDRGGNGSAGLWIWASYINHSCVPNTERDCIGDLMFFRATQPIKTGEEIFQSYDRSNDYDTRQATLMTTWGFECDCVLCATEKKDDPAVRKKRQELANEADAFVAREHWANAKRLTIVKAQRLVRAIDETYDEKRYKDLPRVAKVGIQHWLTQATPRR